MSVTADTPIRHLVVIGLGLIGGSLAACARERQLCSKVIGIARRQEVCARAVELGVVDEAITRIADIAPALGEGDVVFIAVPTLTVAAVLQNLKDCLPDSVTITDGASVKGSVLNDVERIWGCVPANVVLGHPIAGSEKSGVEAANPTLYDNHRVILTPTAETGAEHINRVTQLWAGAGAEVLELDVAEHDEILAATSHLPHVIAYSLVDTLAHDSKNQNIFRYAAGGFRDFTRIASSDATMWRDIMLANKDAILQSIDLFSANLANLRTAVASSDGQELMGVFTRAKAARDHFTKMLAQRAFLEQQPDQVDYKITPGGALTGSLQVPGDKSLSHRAVMLGALAEGVTQIEGFLEGEDALATIQAFRDMDVVIEGPHNGYVKVYGVGLHGLKAPAGPIYMGNSGTSMRLLAGILAAQSFDSTLTGDESLSQRPMARIAEPLQQMGAQVLTSEQGTPPLAIKGGANLKGIHYAMPVASAQVKSGLLLAGLYASGETTVVEPAQTRDHTERLLRTFGCPVMTNAGRVSVTGGASLRATHITVPGDISSATFFVVAASICPGSDITLTRVGINPTRAGAIRILQLMGADITLLNERELSGEPVADIRVQFSALNGIDIPPELVPSAMDEFPALFIAAACAKGITKLTHARELRVKESDRIAAMASGLRALGIACQARDDGIVIEGGVISPGEVDSFGDHRVAMAFAVAGAVASGDVLVKNCACVATSFPTFTRLAVETGISLDVFNS